MKTFHAQRQIVEHPEVLFCFLRDRGISLRIHDGIRATGRMRDIDFYIKFHLKRFRGNLSLRVDFPKVSFPPKPCVDELRVVLATLKRPFEVCDEFCTVVAEIGILPLDSPLEEELNFVTSHSGGNIKVSDIVRAVREQQKLLSSFLATHDFESAARHRDRGLQLLDSLYDLCVCSIDA